MFNIFLEGNQLNPQKVDDKPLKRGYQISETLGGNIWATRSSANVKHVFMMRYTICGKNERSTLKTLFSNGGVQTLDWYDGNTYNVIWGSSFGLTSILSSKEDYKGTIQLYQV